MKHYTDTIPLHLAEKLKEKGMPIRYEQTDEGMRPVTTFGACFDWLMSEKSHMIIVLRGENKWEWWIGLTTDNDTCNDTVEIEGEPYGTWHEAANKAIEKALTLI